MSMRAYRQLTRPVEADNATFNISDSYELWEDIVNLDGSYDGISDGVGTFDVDVDELERYINSKKFIGSDEQRQSFSQDIKDEKAKGNNYITYICY